MCLLFLAAQNYRNLLYLKNLWSILFHPRPIHYLDRNHLSKHLADYTHNTRNSQREGRRRF